MAEEPLDFGTEEVGDARGQAFTQEVSAKDIFELGKKILLAILILFIVLATARISLDPTMKGIEEVWEYSKIFLSNIVSLILGYYFGDKKSESKRT